MEDAHKDLIRDNRMELCDLIRPGVVRVVRYLYQKRILSYEMEETILQANQTPTDMTFSLLDIIKRRGPLAFGVLYEATLDSELWGAADILQPQNFPHEPNDIEPRSSGSDDFTPTQIQFLDILGQRLDLDVPSLLRYRQVIQRENVNREQPRRVEDQRNAQQPSPQDTEESVQNTFVKRRDLVQQRKVPLNLYDWVHLAAIERLAGLEEGTACQMCDVLIAKVAEYRDKKIEDLRRECCSHHEAINKYNNVCCDHTFGNDTMFFQVWEQSHPSFIGPKLLAIDRTYVRFLDIASKQVIRCWPMYSFLQCRLCTDASFTVVLEFQNEHQLKMLSFDHHTVYDVITRLNQ